jgi:putative ABC transport system permease protein
MLQDIRDGWRTLRRAPGFAVLAVSVLALGIGSATSMFTILNAALLKPLPFQDPQQLVDLAESNRQQHIDREEVSYKNFLDWRQQAKSFQQLAAYLPTTALMRQQQNAAQIPVAYASAEIFQTLGVTAERGRFFTPAEDLPLSGSVVVVSDDYWRKYLNSDRRVVGSPTRLDDRVYTIIGVAPPQLRLGPNTIEVWLPLGAIVNQSFMQIRAVHVVSVIGRLKPGVTMQAATAEMQTIAARVHLQYPTEDADHSVAITDLHELLTRGSRSTALMLFGAIMLLLVVACANVANLLLARAAIRHREVAIRRALGATSIRILRQLFTESLLLTFIGGALGIVIAIWSVSLGGNFLTRFMSLPFPPTLDRHVLYFALGISVMVGVCFGLAPGIRLRRDGLSDSLKVTGSSQSTARSFLSRGLVAVEVSLTFVLLGVSLLLTESLWHVLSVEAGFRTDHLLTLTVSLPETKYRETQQVVSFFSRLSAHLASLPDVKSVSATSALPISGGDSLGSVSIEDQPFDPRLVPVASYRRVLPGYFEMMRIPLLSGRSFDNGDNGKVKVVIVNAAMAKQLWPGKDPVGQRIKIGPPSREPWLTIVGVVGDVHNVSLEAAPTLDTYEPYAQRPWTEMKMLIRSAGDPLTLSSSAQKTVSEVDSDAAVFDVASMEQRISDSVASRRLNAIALGAFALLGLALGTVGLYGVISYIYAQRTREIGIRMAFGASRTNVLTMVVAEGLRLTAIGLLIGVPLTIAAARALQSFLFAIRPTDLLVLAIVSGMLLLCCAAAAYVPARRASATEPLIALRCE